MEKELREKIDTLLHEHEEIRRRVEQLGERCQQLSEELEKSQTTAPAPPESGELKNVIASARKNLETSTPPPLPPEIQPTEVPTLSKATPAERKQAETNTSARPAAPPKEISSPPQPPKSPVPPKFPDLNTGEWELAFGKVWMVRIGILLLLTGLVFLSTYAYKNLVLNAGPVVKLTFFMSVSIALTGIGLWLDHWKERFRQYGRVVASGGLAAGYYTVYASHFVPSLKLVDNPVLAGVLLTLWAGLMLGYAVWKKSRIVAVMAIGLAFYGTIVNPSGWLSLFSALLLSGAGMWLMLKFRWMAVGLGTVVAAYVAHAFWLGFYPQAVGSPVRFTYLTCYWLLFTTSLAMPGARRMETKIQRAFASINNSAAWCLTVFMVPQMQPHAEIGWISIGIGTLWLSIAAASRIGKLGNKALAVVFGYQGLLVASLGILLEATGYTRFLVMAVEACVLIAGARHFGGWLARMASAGAFMCALLASLPDSNGGVAAPWPSYAALALVCAIYTTIVRKDATSASQHKDSSNGDMEASDPVPLIPATMTWLVAGFGVFSQWHTTDSVHGLMLTPTLLMAACFLTPSPRIKAWIGDVAIEGILAFLAGSFWYLTSVEAFTVAQSVTPLACIAVYWWMSPRLARAWQEYTEPNKQPAGQMQEWSIAVLFWIAVAATMGHHFGHIRNWMVAGGLVAIAGHAVAQSMRRASIGLPAILFHLPALLAVLIHGGSESVIGWLPAAWLILHLALTDKLWNVLPKVPLRALLALGAFIAAGVHAFQEFDRPDLFLAAFGLAMSAWAYQSRAPQFAFTGGTMPLVTACLVAISIHDDQDWLRYPAVLSALLAHALLWLRTGEIPNRGWKTTRTVLLTAGIATLYYAATLHVKASFDGSGVAICWALLSAALFCAGLALRCRPYRLIGLWWLAAAVLHVLCIDVMKLDTLGRILSFICLGLVLLALGFLYNRFQETIRKFL